MKKEQKYEYKEKGYHETTAMRLVAYRPEHIRDHFILDVIDIEPRRRGGPALKTCFKDQRRRRQQRRTKGGEERRREGEKERRREGERGEERGERGKRREMRERREEKW